MSGERKEEALRKGQSVYSPYYAKIQDLLFQGMPVKEVWLYMKIFFGVYADIRTLYHYIEVMHLSWYMPERKKVEHGGTDRVT